MGVFLGPAAGCPVLCGHRGCRGRWPVLRTADSQSLPCQGLSLCSPRSAARLHPRAFPWGFPVPQNPRSLHRLHLALAATVAELTRWTGGDGEPPSSGAELARSAHSRPLRVSWPLLPSHTVDTDGGHTPVAGTLSGPRFTAEPSKPVCRLSPQPAALGSPLGPALGLSRRPCHLALMPSSSAASASPPPYCCSATSAPGPAPAQGARGPTRLNSRGVGAPSHGWSHPGTL